MILDLEKTEHEKTVVLATNFTEGARNSCRFAIQLFKNNAVNYILLNSYYEPPIGHDALYSTTDLLERNSEKKLENEKKLLLAEFEELKLSIKCVSVFGLLVSAINDTVEHYKADYVVIGNKPSYDLESVLLGYKTANFIRKIKCPVIAIPSNISFKDMKVVTFASDMKKIKDLNVLSPVLDIVKRQEAQLNILYVSNEDEILVGQQAEAGLYLDNYFTEIPHEFHHSSNQFIISGISRFVENSNSGLVILLARKHNFLERLRESSKTQMMSELAKTPLLVLHE